MRKFSEALAQRHHHTRYVVLNQISLVCKVYYKYRKQTLFQKYLDPHGCLERRHDFTKDPSRSQKHCFLYVLQVVMTWKNVQPLCNTCVHCVQSSQDHRNHQCSTMPHAAYLHSQVAVLCQLLSMFLANVAISRTADINKMTSVCLLSGRLALIFLAVGMVVSHIIVMSSVSTSLSG